MRAVVVALLCLVAGMSDASAQRVHFDPGVSYRVPAAGPRLGPDDALVTIVEFSDFYCGFCRRANATLRKLMQLYPGEIGVVYMHAPLDPEEGTLAAQASIAAQAQGQFWPMHDRIFAGPRGADRELLVRYASDLGLDVERFRAELDSGVHRKELQRYIGIGAELGVSSTPIFFVNGRPITGARGLGTFVRVVEEELERARGLVAAGVPKSKIYQAMLDAGRSRGTTTEPPPRASPSIEAGRRYPVGLGLASHFRGPQDALVTLVEFSDFECQYCRRARPTVEKLREIYGDQLRVVFRHQPVAFHQHALLAAEASVEAASQGKFWPYHDLLLANQRALTRTDLERYAEQLGLDLAKFRAALDERRHMQTVLADTAEGAALGVNGTPTFFINGVAIVGARPLQEFRTAIDAEIDYAKKVIASGVSRKELYAHLTTGGADSKAPSSEKIEIDEVDYHIAVLIACRSSDHERARAFYKEVKDKVRRKLIVSDCKRLGVDLSGKSPPR